MDDTSLIWLAMSYLPNYMNLAIKLPSSYNLANMTFMIQVSLIKNTLVL